MVLEESKLIFRCSFSLQPDKNKPKHLLKAKQHANCDRQISSFTVIRDNFIKY